MNNKFKKATKRIAAVGASALMVSSAAFAGLNYPTNFADSGVTVVIGSQDDASAAAAVVADLKAEFAGGETKYIATATKAAEGTDEVLAEDSGKTLNYGETIDDAKTVAFDADDMNVLADGSFDNGAEDQDYEQTFTLGTGTGAFEYSLREDLDEDISNHIYYANDDVVGTFKLEFDSAIDFDGTDQDSLDADFVGESIDILGSTYTVVSIGMDGTPVIDKLELIGGSNKVSLGEGETTTVSIDGVDYEVSVQSVSSTKVLLSVNGEGSSVDLYETEDIAGTTIAVTDLVESSRESVKGYSEIVIGGNKIFLEEGAEVKLNDDDISDIYEDYVATATFLTAGAEEFTGFEIAYSVDDEMMLSEGDIWEDHVFNALGLKFDGTNNVDYSDITFKVASDDDITLEGTTIGGDAFSHTIAHAVDKTAVNSTVRLLGGDDDVDTLITRSAVSINMSVAANEQFRFLVGDKDDQEWWEFTDFDATDGADFEDVLTGSTEEDVDDTEWVAKLTEVTSATVAAEMVTAIAPLFDSFAFEGEALVNVSDVAVAEINATTPTFTITLDAGDVDVDSAGADDDEALEVTFTLDTTNDELELGFSTAGATGVIDFGGDQDLSDSNDNEQEYRTAYGTKIFVDSENDDEVRISVPDEQVEGKVYLVAGSGASETTTKTFETEADADAWAEDMEADGYTVEIEEETSTAVDVEVSSAVLDSEVTGMDDMVVVGGPAVNSVARALMGIETYSVDQAGVSEGEGTVRYFEDSNSVLVYGWAAADTAAAVSELNSGSNDWN